MGLPTTGSGLAPQPGLALEIDLAEGIFRPLASKQRLQAVRAEEAQARLNTTLQVSTAYYELIQAYRMLSIAEDAAKNAGNLAKVTDDFAQVGEGLQADAERAAVESLIQMNNVEVARVGTVSASMHFGSTPSSEQQCGPGTYG